jgi:hypothetical protein
VSFYLLDNPPTSPQFYPSRQNPPTWAVSIHTSEGSTGPGSALDLARFISRRPDPGSYACVVDSNETIHMVPPLYTTYSVAASGYNSRTWSICLAGKSRDLHPDDPNTIAMLERAGEAIAALWTLVGVDVLEACKWIATDALNRPGLFCHGDVQPWDRTDAWSIHPQRGDLDFLLIVAIARHIIPPQPPTPATNKGKEMFHLTNTDGRDTFIALTDGGQVVASTSSKPGGKFAPWTELKGGIAGSNLYAEKAPDGRLTVTLAATGELWGSWQTSPGASTWCDWFRVNDLRALNGC